MPDCLMVLRSLPPSPVMKFAVVLCYIIISTTAEPPPGPSGGGYGPPSRPSPRYGSPTFSGYGGGGGEDNSELANYEFKYDVDAPEYNVKFGHQEGRQGEVATGKYYVLLPDGRTQTVEYIADQDGYRPKISYQGGGGGQGGAGGYGRGPQGGNGGYRK